MARKQKRTLVQRVTADLSDAAMDVRRRLLGGETKRGLAGRKAAMTRKRNAAKRGLAAKKGAATRRAKAAR
jgi:hypothetical protein